MNNARRDCSREVKSIKVSIGDELSEIETTIQKMNEVWEKSKTLYPSYLSALQENTSAFDGLRERLFCLKNATLRKRVVAFYKKFKDTVKENKGKVGSLAETPDVKAEQANIASTFKALEGEAKSIREELESKSWWNFR